MQNDSTPRRAAREERFIKKLIDEYGHQIAARYFAEHPEELRQIAASYVASNPEVWPAFRAEVEELLLWAEGMRLGIVAAEGDS